MASKKLELYKGALQTSQLIVRLIFGSATKASNEGVTKEPGEHVGRSHNVNPGIRTDEGIVSAIPSVFIGFDAEIAGIIDQA